MFSRTEHSIGGREAKGGCHSVAALLLKIGRRIGFCPKGTYRLKTPSSAKTSSKILTGLVIAVLILGVLLVCYPLVSDFFYERAASTIIAKYDEAVRQASEGDIERELARARGYNDALRESRVIPTRSFDRQRIEERSSSYESILNIAGDGVIGHVEVPKIGIDLPVYHGVSAEVLEEGIGHMPNTSFPIGEPGTHAVLTGHTGLIKARMFTDLPRLVVGDVFYVHVLNRVLAYKVDQINIVDPTDSSALGIVEDKEYVTLLTCYPYGVNSHRLLVRGEGISLEEAQKIDQERVPLSVWDSQYARALVICLLAYVPIGIGVVVFLKHRHRNRIRERARARLLRIND